MKTGVTKYEFIKSLESTLKLTREGVHSLELIDEDLVRIIFLGGGTTYVNIHCDSAAGIIRDVMKHVG